MKEHTELFKFLAFQLNYGKESKLTGRIALIRQYENELSVVDAGVEPNDMIKNDVKIFDFCKILRAAQENVSGKTGKK